MVGNEIDTSEARYFSIFRDIDNFVSARFFENSDSIIVRVRYVVKNDTCDSSINIEKDIFESFKNYLHNFHQIIEDEDYRVSFIKNHKIGWPIVSDKEINEVGQHLLINNITNSLCCITGTAAAGAYTGALIGRKIQRHEAEHTCFLPDFSGGCIEVTIPYEYYTYSVNPACYYGTAGAGCGSGYILSKKLYKTEPALNQAIRHDILAFDDDGYPITKEEVIRENKGGYLALLGTLGIIAGLAGTTATALLLISPWIDLRAETDWDEYAVTVPIVIISGIEFLSIAKFGFTTGKRLDHQATIETIKKKRTARE